MKLVETDVTHEEDVFSESRTQPRPEHRRVYVSLLLTFSVLATTVGVVYGVFPQREKELIHAVVAFHTAPPSEFALSGVSDTKLSGWVESTMTASVSLPSTSENFKLFGARTVSISRKPVIHVNYRLKGYTVSLFVLRSRGALPREFHEYETEWAIRSWRDGRFTLIGVGPRENQSEWLATLQKQ